MGVGGSSSGPAACDVAASLRAELNEAKADAAHYRKLSQDAVREVASLESQRGGDLWRAVALGTASAALGAALGGMTAAMAARRANAAALARTTQEMIDLRRRGAAELERARRFGGEKLARSLVPALDAMDALCASDAGSDSEGRELTRATFHTALGENSIEVIRPDHGDKFDVGTMEALYTVPVAADASTGLVEDIMRPGYVLHGERVLRAAQVGVGEHR